MKNRTFQAHIRRIFTMPMFYICIVLYFLLLMLPSLNPPTENSFMSSDLDSLWYYAQMVSTGMPYIAATVVPALAYAVTYMDDYDTRLLYVWAMRSGTERYAVSYFIATLAAGFLVAFGGNLLFLAVNDLRGFPFVYTASGQVRRTVYSAWYNNGYPVLYVLAHTTEYALGASTMAGLAAAIGCTFNKRVAMLGLPAMYYFCYDLLPLPKLFDPYDLCGISEWAETPLANMGQKLMVCAVYWVVCGFVTVRAIGRSVENA